jgi:hypothetical protein
MAIILSSLGIYSGFNSQVSLEAGHSGSPVAGSYTLALVWRWSLNLDQGSTCKINDNVLSPAGSNFPTTGLGNTARWIENALDSSTGCGIQEVG